MEVKVINNEAIIKCQYHEKELVKAIGDFKFDKASATWRFPVKKLVDIIEELRIEYSPETDAVYQQLRLERQRLHSLINTANEIKNNIKPDYYPNLSFEQLDLSACYAHQKKAVQLAALFDSYALFLEPGLGKSNIAIKLIQYWKVPAIVVAPLSTLENVWVNEIEKWAPDLKKVVLWHNLKAFNSDYDVYIINFEGFKKLVKESKTPIEDKVQCLIIDESAKMKNSQSQITKTILKYKNNIKHRIVLSGVPNPNSLLEFWAQMAFVNEDLLGSNFYRFRNTHFFSYGYGGYQYKPNAGAKEAIMDKISRQAFSVKKEDALDLPEQVYETRLVYMDQAQQNAYDTMKKENILEFKDSITLAANELAKICKLREITGGFIINTTGLPVKISNSKIDILKELLEEIPADRQVIIWVQYHWEVNELKSILGDSACTLYGAMPQKEKIKSIEDFQNNKYRIIIAHPLSGGTGINFQNCSYIIWYSLSYSSEQYLQANDRCHRIGQHHKCTYFHLLAKDSIDEIIYNALSKKINLIDSCLEMLKK